MAALVGMPQAVASVEEDAMLAVPSEVPLDNTETKWRRPVWDSPILHAGRYVVDWVHNGQAYLADADWSDAGEVTFKSEKHGHVVALEDLALAISLGQVVRVRFGG